MVLLYFVVQLLEMKGKDVTPSTTTENTPDPVEDVNTDDEIENGEDGDNFVSKKQLLVGINL